MAKDDTYKPQLDWEKTYPKVTAKKSVPAKKAVAKKTVPPAPKSKNFTVASDGKILYHNKPTPAKKVVAAPKKAAVRVRAKYPHYVMPTKANLDAAEKAMQRYENWKPGQVEKNAAKKARAAKAAKNAQHSVNIKAAAKARRVNAVRVAGRVAGKALGAAGLVGTAAEAARLATTKSGRREYMDMRKSIDNAMRGKNPKGKDLIPKGTMYTTVADSMKKKSKRGKK